MSEERRAAMMEAFNKVEAEEKGEEYVPSAESDPGESNIPAGDEKDPGVVEQEAADRSREREDKNRPAVSRTPEEKAGKVGATPKTGEQPQEQAGSQKEQKAPNSWTPSERELWAKVPPEVKAVIQRRETQIQQVLSHSDGARRVAQEYVEVIKPFEQVIQSMGTTPREAVSSVMQTATALIIGTQEQKAAVLAEMFDRYGVDLGYLDKYLAARAERKPPPTHSGAAPSGTMQPLDPRLLQTLKPLFDLQKEIQETKAQREQRTQAQAQEAIASMEAQPYFEDLREDIADVLELSAKRGVVLTLQQAYEKAVQLNPEVSKILGQRKQAATQNTDMSRRRRAASSVSGAPNPSSLNPRPGDRRAAIAQAWDEAG